MTDSASRPLSQVRSEAIAALSAAGVPDPEVDADLMIGHVLDASRGRVQALAVADAALPPEQQASIARMVERRATREPVQHILGTAAFRSIRLEVGPGVFVPRPETELVAQFAIDALSASAAAEPIAVDLGSGSGAIALAMAVEVPRAAVYAVERSPEAFAWMQRNVRNIAPQNTTAVLADLADALPELDGTVEVVISNPPYVPADAVPRDPEVRLFDPPAALYGGADGLDVVRRVSHTALRLLHAGGSLVLEHGEEQGEQIRALLAADGWRAAATHPDLTMRERATTALRP